MLKRVFMTFAFTVFITVALGFLYTWLMDMPYVGLDGARFFIGIILVCSAALLCRRSFRWPELLCFTCATAYLLGASVDLFISVAITHSRDWPSISSFLFHGCQVNPVVYKPAHALRLFGICFPIPLFAIIWRRVPPASNQSMQPTIGRSNA